MKPARPESVRVLGKTFTVTLEPARALNRLEVGLCDEHTQTITVLEGLHPEDERETLLHEVLHAVDHAMHCELSEHQVSALSRGLLAVLIDNPAFGAWLLERSGGV